jgi:hypothetical protein
MLDTIVTLAEVPEGTRCQSCGYKAGDLTYSTLNGIPYGHGSVVDAPTLRRVEWWGDREHVGYWHVSCAAQPGFDLAQAASETRAEL